MKLNPDTGELRPDVGESVQDVTLWMQWSGTLVLHTDGVCDDDGFVCVGRLSQGVLQPITERR